jgi:uncharacterized membrane protein
MRSIKDLQQRLQRDERGATLVIVAICMALLMPVALAFSVELGEETVVNRSLQAAADAGALDAARYISVSSAEVTSFGDNGVTNNDSSATASVDEGWWCYDGWSTTYPEAPAGTTTTCPSAMNAVLVTASSKVQHISEAGSIALSRSAVGYESPPSSEFSLGTSLASLTLSNKGPLDSVMGLLGLSGNLDVVGYNGLADTDISVQQLIDASASFVNPSTGVDFTGSGILAAALPPQEWEAIVDQAIATQAISLGCPSNSNPTCSASSELGSLTPTTVSDSCNSAAITQPDITNVSPDLGPATGGTQVTITGAGLSGATAVDFGSTAVSVTADSATSVTANSPPGAAGVVDVTVVTPSGTSTDSYNDQFTYTGTPVVSSISPNSGPVAGGTTVTISGTNFGGISSVMIGGVAATDLTYISSTSITAVTPAESAGPAAVTVTTTYGASNASTFTYEGVPTISSIVSAGLSTATGSTTGGTVVTITGTNFVTSDGTTAVSFGGSAGNNVTIVSATQIKVSSPTSPLSGNGTGAVTVMVSDAGGTSSGTRTTANTFTYGLAPTITNVSGISLLGLSYITITGTNLSNAVTVDLGPYAGNVSTDTSTIIKVSSTQLLSILGSLDASVVTPYGTASYGLSGLLSFVVHGSASPQADLVSKSSSVASRGAVEVVEVSASGALLANQGVTPRFTGAAVKLADDLSKSQTTSSETAKFNGGSAPTTPAYRLTAEDSTGAVACVSLCQLVSINGSTCSSGSLPQSALSADLNALDTLTTDAELANGTGVTLSSGLSLPGVATATLFTTLVEPPQVAYGPVGTRVSASQVNVDLQLSLLGLGTLNIPITGADGTATLSAMSCVQNTMTSTQFQVSTTAISDSVLLTIGSIPFQVATLVSGLSSTPLFFTNPAAPNAIVPPTAASENAGTNPQTIGTTSPQFKDIAPVVALVLNALSSTLSPLLSSLGVSVANATVTDLNANCAPIELVQ